MLFVSGQGPRSGGDYRTGKLGYDVSVEQGYQHAKLAGLAILAAMHAALGTLERVRRVAKVFGMVNATPEFADHATVINGCSDLFIAVFHEAGHHARSAVGMASLPYQITVEVEAIVEVVEGQ